MKASGIYAIRNTVNNKHYVGSAVYLTQRFCDHKKRLRARKHHSIKLQRAWNKHGEESFSFEVLQLVQEKKELIATEQEWIDRLNAAGRRSGYNVSPTAGSCLGVKHGSATRAKMSAASRGRVQSKDTVEKRANALRGQKRSVSAKALMSVKAIGNRRNVGRKHTDEARANMSAARIGIKFSEETLRRMSLAHMGHVQSDETRYKRAASMRVAWARRKQEAAYV